MRVLVLTRYGHLPAPSRYRFYQYLAFLTKLKMEFTVSNLLDDGYVQRQYSTGRFPIGPLPKIYLSRLLALLRVRQFDLIWLEKEALPWTPAWVELAAGLSRVPYVVDYDDAIFHTYDRSALARLVLSSKIRELMRHAELVVVGNDYLGQYARRAGAKRVELLPSVVDLDRYPFPFDGRDKPGFTIGWIGAPANSRHLSKVADALRHFCQTSGARLRIVGGSYVPSLKGLRVEYQDWSERTEIAQLGGFDVGIMPLYDGLWERGKCGLKLINYMAAELPTIASPVGVNAQIVDHGTTGFLAETTEEWVDALNTLWRDKSLRRSMGRAGRIKVERHYSLHVAAPRLAEWLREAASA